MARTRTGLALIDDAYALTDLAAFTDRHPRTEVLRHVNQGGAELWDIMLEAFGRAFARSATPWTITTTASTTSYTSGFPSDFMDLLSVRLEGPGGEMLRPLLPAEEAWNREPDMTGVRPLFYELVPGALRLLPEHPAGLTVTVEYLKTWTDLSDSSGSSFDGVDGWEDFVVAHAAKKMLLKEGERTEAQDHQDNMDRIRARILRRAPKRDMYRPRRARDVRGEQMLLPRNRWRI